jgi:hypothetical protein
MKITFSHNSTAEDARTTVVDQVPELMKRVGSSVSNSSYDWDGNVMEFSFRAAAADFRGTLEIKEREIVLVFNVPLRFRLFQGTIEAEARKWCREVFGPSA